MRRAACFLFLIALAVGGACGHRSSGGGGTGIPTDGIGGVVFSYTEEPLAGVPVKWQDSSGAGISVTGPDGRFFVTPLPVGNHVFEIGDGVTTPVTFVAVTGGPEPSFLARPIFLPSFPSGVQATVPPSVSVATVVSSAALQDASLSFAAGASVSYPVGALPVVSIVGVSPSRLPAPLPGGLVARAAYHVEPARARFAGATLGLPRLDDAASAPFDVWLLDPATASWRITGTVAAAGTFALTAPVSDGGLYAVAPRTPAPTVTVTGRVVSGASALEGWRAECWNRVSTPTGTDGRFTITGVPSSFGGNLVRVSPARAGIDFAPEVASAFATTQDVGDIVVRATPADAIRPTVVSTTPADKQTAVDIRTQVVVRFSEAIDPKTLLVSVRGAQGDTAGLTILDAPFQARFIPAQPLRPSDTYSIVLGDDVRDLAGNALDKEVVFKFDTQAVPAATKPTDTLLFGLSPLLASAGDTLVLKGRNFTGGTKVTIGGSLAPPVAETPEEIRVRAPDFEPASDAAVALTTAGQAVPAVGPFVLDLRGSVGSISSGTVARLAPPAMLVVLGKNLSQATLTVDGVSIASVETTTNFGPTTVVAGKVLTLAAPVPPSLLTGPLVARGANGKTGILYRFLQVREGGP